MKYFTIGEMVSSNTADRNGINNMCKKEHLNNIIALINNVLDPLREAYGKPIRVTSGYRCEELNKAVGGSNTSDHMKGCAADIVGTPATKEENKHLFELIQSLHLPFKQLIWEKGESSGPDWVHVSYDKNNIKRQILKL